MPLCPSLISPLCASFFVVDSHKMRAALVLGAWLLAACALTTPSRPNVLVMIADDLG